MNKLPNFTIRSITNVFKGPKRKKNIYQNNSISTIYYSTCINLIFKLFITRLFSEYFGSHIISFTYIVVNLLKKDEETLGWEYEDGNHEGGGWGGDRGPLPTRLKIVYRMIMRS